MYRKEALEAKNRKWESKALLINTSWSFLISIVCFLMIIAMILFIIQMDYTRRVNVNGVITSYPRPVDVNSTSAGVVKTVFVSQGEKINKNQKLFEIDVSVNTKDGNVGAISEVLYDSQLKYIESIINKTKLMRDAATLSAREEEKIYKRLLSSTSKVLKKSEDGVEKMRKELSDYEGYFKRGLINKDQLANKLSTYYQNQTQLAYLLNQKVQNELKVKTIENTLKNQINDFENKISQENLRKEELLRGRLNSGVGRTIVVKSKISGYIDSINLSKSQMISPGDKLIKIIPDDISGYRLVAWVTNDSLPFIKVGEEVNMIYQAFPQQKYGKFTGSIESISNAPASTQEMVNFQAPPEVVNSLLPMFKLTVIPKTIEFRRGNYSGKVQNGMIAKTTIFLEKRRIYQWMFTPYYTLANSVVGQPDEKK